MTIDFTKQYGEFLTSHASLKRPIKVVTDSSNGTTGLVLKHLLKIPNLTLVALNDSPNPDFPAHGPNPLALHATDELAKKVLAEKADMGVAFDADGDRVFFIDENGRSLPSFEAALIFFDNYPGPFVTDELIFMSLRNSSLFQQQKELFPTPVGSIFLKKAMKEHRGNIGAEYSGHFYFKDFFGLDSGIFAMITMLTILSSKSESLSQLRDPLCNDELQDDSIAMSPGSWEKIYECIVKTYKTSAEIFNREGVTVYFSDNWLNIRPSNTEIKLRIIAGGERNANKENVARMKELIASCA